MKVQRIGEFRTVSLTNLGEEKIIAISHNDEIESTMTLRDAEKLADQILAWSIPTAYNLKDEDGNSVSDEVAMKGLE